MKQNKKIKPHKAILEYLNNTGMSQRHLSNEALINEAYLCNRLKTGKPMGTGTLAKLQIVTEIDFFTK
jgi:lambda repressor-like predicted transcriptional regulator